VHRAFLKLHYLADDTLDNLHPAIPVSLICQAIPRDLRLIVILQAPKIAPSPLSSQQTPVFTQHQRIARLSDPRTPHTPSS
jgi:hypothetical protein